MAKLNTMEKIVLSVLEESRPARKDDCILMYCVCEKINSDILRIPFGTAMYNHKHFSMPNWETVTRCRRKIQEKHPELIDEETEKLRIKAEDDYRAYARS